MSKGQIISFWANAEENAEIERRARKEKRSKSNYIRCQIFKESEK